MSSKLFYLLIALLIANCTKNKITDEASDYMNQIIQQNYPSNYLPSLEVHHITSLLEYADNRKVITKFPRNLLSSFYQENVTVGIIALWTVESIRLSELAGGVVSDINRFPSLNPILFDTTRTISERMILQTIASESYSNWWKQPNLSIDKRMELNPLANTNIIWQ